MQPIRVPKKRTQPVKPVIMGLQIYMDGRYRQHVRHCNLVHGGRCFSFTPPSSLLDTCGARWKAKPSYHNKFMQSLSFANGASHNAINSSALNPPVPLYLVE